MEIPLAFNFLIRYGISFRFFWWAWILWYCRSNRCVSYSSLTNALWKYQPLIKFIVHYSRVNLLVAILSVLIEPVSNLIVVKVLDSNLSVENKFSPKRALVRLESLMVLSVTEAVLIWDLIICRSDTLPLVIISAAKRLVMKVSELSLISVIELFTKSVSSNCSILFASILFSANLPKTTTLSPKSDVSRVLFTIFFDCIASFIKRSVVMVSKAISTDSIESSTKCSLRTLLALIVSVVRE